MHVWPCRIEYVCVCFHAMPAAMAEPPIEDEDLLACMSPSPDDSASTAEDIEAISREERDADPLFRVKVEKDGFMGVVEEIEQGSVSKERLYRVRYADTDLEHFSAAQVERCRVEPAMEGTRGSAASVVPAFKAPPRLPPLLPVPKACLSVASLVRANANAIRRLQRSMSSAAAEPEGACQVLERARRDLKRVRPRGTVAEDPAMSGSR